MEESIATIEDNIITSNMKANIAFGGKHSGRTIIKKNDIANGKAEGIFLVEGEDEVQISENKIHENADGIVLFNSKGKITNNEIFGNQRSGVMTAGTTNTTIERNKIQSNLTCGVLVKEPSYPLFIDNSLKENHY